MSTGVILLALCSVSPTSAVTGSCGPVATPAKDFTRQHIVPGTYHLVLVATGGPKKGASVEGELWLAPTSPGDISPRTGKKASPGESLAEVPLFGSANIDYSAVGAPVWEPTTSRDPIFPGVLVRVTDWEGVFRQPVVVIGSEGNRRDGTVTKDGSGIGLTVQQITEAGFAGTWDAWGRKLGGKGYFCANRIKGLDEPAEKEPVFRKSPLFQLQVDRYGPVEIGMTPEEAFAKLGAALPDAFYDDEDEDCYYTSPYVGDDFAFMVVKGRIARIDVFLAGIESEGGIRIGDSEEAVRRAFPGRVKEEPHPYLDEEGKYLIVETKPGFAFVFETDKGKVTTFRSGELEAVLAIEGCL
jgi:hypothetical protein